MSELAQQLIEKEKKEKTGKLDLGNCGLTEIPKEVFELTWLEELSLSDVVIDGENVNYSQNKGGGNSLRYKKLPLKIRRLEKLKKLCYGDLLTSQGVLENADALATLTGIQTLYIISNKISDTRFLEGLTGLQTLSLILTSIRDISFLEDLTGLQTLDLRHNKISDIRFLEGLTGIQNLGLSSNQISDFSFLEGLTGLRNLDLSSNQINDISFLKGLTGLKDLDLSSNQIKDISFLKGLTGLKDLDLSSNQIKDISFLKGLTGLKDLDLSSNQISDISFLEGLTGLQSLDLSSNQISDISFLEGLTGLQSLDLRSNQVNDISFLKGLTGLKDLDLRTNQINDISFLKGLTGLKDLDLRTNQINDISFLKGLTGLKDLDLSSNQINDISFLKGLTGLRNLALNSNQISDISPISNLIQSGIPVNIDQFGEGINLFDNPITKPPIEIVKQGNEAILTYFESLEGTKKEGKGIVQLNEVKVLLLGEGMAGKTSLLKRLKGLKFNKHESKTHGINIENLRLAKLPVFKHYPQLKDVVLNVWDFGGQEIMHASHQIFLTNRSIYIYVLDSRTGNKKDYWLHHIERFGGSSPAFVAINKIDKNPNYELERSTLNRKYPFIQNRFHRISCESGEGLEELKRQLSELIPQTELFQTAIPESWLRIKHALEEATDQKRYIGEKEFIAICSNNGVEKPRERNTLLKFLHDLGVVFHFEKLRLKGFYVLDPLWVTVGIYRIINTYDITNGILTESRLNYILNQEEQKKEEYTANEQDWEYNHSEQINLLEIMEEFELLYPIGKKEYLVPDLLPKEPEVFSEAPEDALHFVLLYDFLTQSLYNRLIVQMKDDIRDYLKISGVQSFFENSTCDAKAVIYLDLDKRRIDIYVWGHEKRQYLTIIRDKLEKIHQNFSGLKVERKLPVPGHPNVLVDFDELVGLERMGQTEYPLGKLGKRFFISEDFLDKVTTKGQRMEDRKERLKLKDHRYYGGDISIDFKPEIHLEQHQRNEQKVEVSIEIQIIQHTRDEVELLKESIEMEKARLINKMEEDEVEDAITDLTTVQNSLKELEVSQRADQKAPNKVQRLLGQVFKDFEDEESPIRKTLRHLRRGKDYGVNLARQYNKLAERFGFNPVPSIVLDALEKL
jgi:internalin A